MNVQPTSEIRALTAAELDAVSGGMLNNEFSSGFSWSAVLTGAIFGAMVFNAIGFIDSLIDYIFD